MDLDFLLRLLGRDSNSKKIAKERLRLVLVHDRTAVSPQVIESIKEEIIRVISKYMEIDERRIEVELNNIDNSVALTASIPVRNVKRGYA